MKKVLIALFIILPTLPLFTKTGVGHNISNIQLSPPSPASLAFNDAVNITFDYATEEAGGVRIFIAPFSNGSLTSNLAAQGSPLYPVGSGSGSSFFLIRSGDVTVDQLRIQMLNADQSQQLLEFFIPVEYHFSGGALDIVNVNAPAINCIFDNDCKITVSDKTDDLLLVGMSGSGFLQSRTWPVGETGTVGEGLYGYLYRIDLRQLVGVVDIACAVSFTIDFGPVSALDYDGNGMSEHVFVITGGGLGSVVPTTVTKSGDTLIFEFAPGVCAGSTPGNGDSSFFFGLASTFASHDVQANVKDNNGNNYVLDARAPNFRPQTVFTVKSTGDGRDSNAGDGICDDGTGNCTLRAAIEEANASAGKNTITFNIPGAGPHTIQPRSELPTIADAVIIDGYTQPGAIPNTNPITQGSNAVLMVELDGTNAGSGVNGLVITAGSSTVRGLAINRFVQGGGRTGEGIHLSTNGGNVIEGNFLGTNITGTDALGGSGVRILSGSGNLIGGTAPAARNIISGNGYGIVMDSNASGNIVQGNFIGTDVTGTLALSNQLDGVAVAGDANTIGGTTIEARNLLSGNVRRGVHLSFRSGNVVQGNFIGTDITGAVTAMGNIGGGVFMFRSSDNRIGGTEAGAGNLIAGNGNTGVAVSPETSRRNRILGNSIFSNARLGIDLGPGGVYGGDGVTTNDTGDRDNGANNLQNFPEIAVVGLDGNGDFVCPYSVDSEPTSSTYPLTIQFFAADASGEGMRLLGDDVYTQVDFSTGTKSVNLGNAMALGISIGDPVVATATDSSGNTSEFSPINTVGVIEGVAIAVSDDTLDYGAVFIGASSTRTLIISNLGTEQLTVSDIFLDNSNYIVDISNFNLNSGESQEVLVMFTPGTPGEFLGTLTITNSDPNKPIMTVALRGMGVLGSPTRLTARAAEDSVSLSWAGKAIEESEPNNTFEIADTLNISQVATGTINPAQDIDFWTFQGTMGQNVTIDVDAQVNGSTLDAVIGLFINEDLDGDGSPDVVVVNDDFGGSFDSRIEINLPKTQTYFIGIVDFSGDGGPNYFYDISLASTSGMLALLSTTSHTPLSRVLHKRGNAKVSGLKSRQMESELSIKLVELPVLKAVASNKVALASSESADLLGYNIYRSNSSPVQVTDGNRIGDVPATTFFFTDMDVQIGTIYYYVVTAFYDQGESEPSNEVSAEPQKKLWEQTGLTNKSVFPLVVSSNDQLFAGVYGDASLGFPGEGMIRSVDNGDTWTQINNGLLNLNIFALAVNSNQHLFAGTDTSGVFRSTDNGDSWSALNTGLPNENDFFSEIRSLAINTNDHIFAATSAGIFRSSDNGNNWVRTGFPSDPGNIAVNSSGHLFAGTQLDGIFRSTDNGGNWQQINTGLPDRTISAIGIDPSDNIFIMTNAGVFLSNNGGDSWTDVTNGIMHFIIAFAFNSSGHIFAGTIDFFGKGGGVYRSTDGGESWTQINAGLTSLNILSLAVNSQDQIFAGTLERGVFRLLEIATSVEDLTGAIPISFVLEQNYPNPFNPTTIIRYQLSEFTHVELTIYNQLGQRIKTLVNERQLAGDYQSEWNGRNEMGQQVSSGVYFYRLRAESFSETQKMILMR